MQIRDAPKSRRTPVGLAELLKQAVGQSEVARRLRVHRQSVIRWTRQLAQSGRAGLKKAAITGRKPRLSGAQLKHIEHRVDPRRLDTPAGCGPRRERDLIEDRCGVRFHEAHIWRIMRQLGWSCHRPTGRALERDGGSHPVLEASALAADQKKRSARDAPSPLSTRAG